MGWRAGELEGAPLTPPDTGSPHAAAGATSARRRQSGRELWAPQAAAGGAGDGVPDKTHKDDDGRAAGEEVLALGESVWGGV